MFLREKKEKKNPDVAPQSVIATPAYLVVSPCFGNTGNGVATPSGSRKLGVFILNIFVFASLQTSFE